jgi:DNA-binding Lrp family transcriptional regulator
MSQDEIRSAILELLQKNARLTDQQIADRLGVTAAVIAAEIAAMEAEGIILGYHVMVNEEKWNHGEVRAMIELEIQPERDGGYDSIAQAICKFPEVRTVYLISGQRDLRLEVVGKSLREIASFVASKLAPLPGVRSTATHFFLKTYKEYWFTQEKDQVYERLPVAP